MQNLSPYLEEVMNANIYQTPSLRGKHKGLTEP